MTRLLISVRNAVEARDALSAGADLIDVKDPARGSLGAAGPDAVVEVVQAVAGKVRVSVALGELRDFRGIGGVAIPCGVSYAKVGMAGCGNWPDWPERWGVLVRRLGPKVGPVAVVYADAAAAESPEPDRILCEAKRLRCQAVLVDTFDKSRGSLLEAWSLDRLAAFVIAVHQEGMLAVVGGSLAFETIPSVAALRPDYIALRGAVCRDGRNGPLDAERVRRAAQEVSLSNS